MKISRKNMIFRFAILMITAFLQNQINAVAAAYAQNLPVHAIILNQNYTTQEKLTKIRTALDAKQTDVNARDIGGKTALNLATFYNANPAIVQLLIVDYKADVNIPDLFNVSPLHNAIEKDEIEIAQMLLDAGADKKLKRDADDATPVDLARSPKTRALFGFEEEKITI